MLGQEGGQHIPGVCMMVLMVLLVVCVTLMKIMIWWLL